MDDVKRYVVLLSLLEAMNNQESWSGETHLQKSVYFLQDMLGVPLNFEYILYKHGPFSFELRDELATMRAHLLVTLEGKDPYGPSFCPGPSSQALKDRFGKVWDEYGKQKQFVAERVSKQDVTSLERLATGLYVTGEMPGSDVQSRARRITELKPHVRFDQAQTAIEEVDKLSEDCRSIS